MVNVKDNSIKQAFINIYYIVFLNRYYSSNFNTCYSIMMLITVFGLIYMLFKKNLEKSNFVKYLLIVTITSIPLVLITWNSMFRDNSLILPVFYYATVGVLAIFKTKCMIQLLIGLFAIYVLGFSYGDFYAQTSTLVQDKQIIRHRFICLEHWIKHLKIVN